MNGGWLMTSQLTGGSTLDSKKYQTGMKPPGITYTVISGIKIQFSLAPVNH